MKLKTLTEILIDGKQKPIHFMLPSKALIPAHFHITEIGRLHKSFIDCGGTKRESISCLLQIWTADDVDHRLTCETLSKITDVAGDLLTDDLPVEIEYGKDVASHYSISDFEITPSGPLFILSGKQTNCLAPDKCGIKCTTEGYC